MSDNYSSSTTEFCDQDLELSPTNNTCENGSSKFYYTKNHPDGYQILVCKFCQAESDSSLQIFHYYGFRCDNSSLDNNFMKFKNLNHLSNHVTSNETSPKFKLIYASNHSYEQNHNRAILNRFKIIPFLSSYHNESDRDQCVNDLNINNLSINSLNINDLENEYTISPLVNTNIDQILD